MQNKVPAPQCPSPHNRHLRGKGAIQTALDSPVPSQLITSLGTHDFLQSSRGDWSLYEALPHNESFQSIGDLDPFYPPLD